MSERFDGVSRALAEPTSAAQVADDVVHEAEHGDDQGLQVHGRPSLRLPRREERLSVAKAPSTTSPARPKTRTSGLLLIFYGYP